jgi:hypothetical protein
LRQWLARPRQNSASWAAEENSGTSSSSIPEVHAKQLAKFKIGLRNRVPRIWDQEFSQDSDLYVRIWILDPDTDSYWERIIEQNSFVQKIGLRNRIQGFGIRNFLRLGSVGSYLDPDSIL